MNLRSVFTLVLFIALFSFSAYSQDLSRKELVRTVQNADVYFYYDENFEKAAEIYSNLHRIYPDNANFAAKLGICYLNIDGRHREALQLLKTASANIVLNDRDYVEFEDKAPLDTYLYLAVAYHQNDSLEKAMSIFNDVKKKYGKTDIFREEYIDNQIRDCRYAIKMKKKPLSIISKLFVPWLENYPEACNPVLAKNDSVFIFTHKTGEETRIMCSYKKNNEWSPPEDITQQLGGYTRFYTNSVTGDGRLLILYMDDGGDGNLYYSEKKGSRWTKIKSPGKKINTIYWESHGFISPDGNTLYFSSNRPGGEGDLDIWVSQREKDGSWEDPKNCGNTINTPFNEDTPFFDPASQALIFSSSGHISMGGYDVFRSIEKNDRWTNPVGMPYALNTTQPNTFFILNNNAPGFITSLFNEKSGSRNIYTIVAVDPADEITKVKGTVESSDEAILDHKKTRITLAGADGKILSGNIESDTEGSFSFELKPGDYEVIVSHPGYRNDTLSFNLPLYYLSSYMELKSTLVHEEVALGAFISLKTILFDFDSYSLDEDALSIIEEVKPLLVIHPELQVAVAGYTDSKGTTAYNMRLSDKRAQAVIDYLASPINPPSRFIKQAFGESQFVAVNTNPDGSDNPEGRRYNRRVTFGIKDPRTGIVLRQETYTPEHLRLPSSIKYSIVLKETAERLPGDYFSSLDLSSMLFLRPIESDSMSVYSVGIFYNRPDAISYLAYVKEKGFTDAYIINHYDLNYKSLALSKHITIEKATGKRIFTIQLLATRTQIDSDILNDIRDVREIKGDDGYYRYVTGEFESEAEAQESLSKIKEAGYTDAYVRVLNLLITK